MKGIIINCSSYLQSAESITVATDGATKEVAVDMASENSPDEEDEDCDHLQAGGSNSDLRPLTSKNNQLKCEEDLDSDEEIVCSPELCNSHDHMNT